MLATEADTNVLRTEFRKIAMVLSMVTAVNNSGYPTLTPLHGDGASSLRRMLNQTVTTTMDSIASLLVRDKEVVAITSILQSSQLDFIVVAPNEGEDFLGPIAESLLRSQSIKEYSLPLPGSSSAVTNTMQNDSQIKNPDYQVMIVESSQSHWQVISDLQALDILKLK